MATYKESGVDVSLGDACSKIAYNAAKKTFSSRAQSKVGRANTKEGGFTGLIDMGAFYLTQNDDGVGTKMMVARSMDDYTTVAQDLVAMVADDAICVGSEVVSLSNTIDTSELSKKVITQMMNGLARVCQKQKIIIPGGEIAELKGMVDGYVWNAVCIGVVAKKKIITGDKIKAGDTVIGIYSPNFRSNGFSLIRHILEKKFGGNWYNKKYGKTTWGKAVLAPSIIYHDAILDLHGRFGEKSKVKIKGVAHITGGGLPGNALRMFGKKKLGVVFDDLFDPPEIMKDLQELGDVSDPEAYKTWNMGVGMIMVVDKRDVSKSLALLKKHRLKAQVVGHVVKEPGVFL